MKNIKFNKELLKKQAMIILLSGTIAVSGVSCGNNKVKTDDISFDKIVRVASEDTLLDEMADESIENKEESIVEKADKLDKCLKTIDKLKSMDFSEVEDLEELPKEKYQEIFDMTEEEIDILIDAVNTKDNTLKSQEEKLKAIKLLNYINNESIDWVTNNGQEVSEEVLMTSIKASIADTLNKQNTIDNENSEAISVSDITISSAPGDPSTIYIDAKGCKYSCKLNTPVWQSINHLYNLQVMPNDHKITHEKIKAYNAAIHFSKVITMTGVDITNSNNMKSKRKEKEALKMF